MSHYQQKYKEAIAEILRVNDQHIHLFWKGRVGLYALLKAMGVKNGDEVVLPAFTCVVVPNAIIYLGAKPIYVDVDRDTLNPTAESIISKITNRTKVVLCQNTFGLSSDVDRISAYCKERNIFTIEDCTHGFGGVFEGKPNGTWCDASFFSTQWNKPFSTGVGGFTYVKQKELKDKMDALILEAERPTVKDEMILKALIMIKSNVLKDWNYWSLLKLYRYLSKKNLVLGSSSGEEIEGVKMPQNYFKLGGNTQAKVGLKSISKLNDLIAERRNNAKQITLLLKNNGKVYVHEKQENNHSFLKYPIFVRDKHLFLELAEQHKVKLGDWFVSSIHPITKEFNIWGVIPEEYPVSLEKSSHILNIHLEGDITRELEFLEKNVLELL